MPLSATRLSSNLKGKIVAINGSAASDAELQAFCDAVAQAVVEEIVSNAQTNSGQHVTVSTSTGIGATDAPGTIS